ncbi:hypothetical protein AMATHDRAFT_74502 [Amanita thiersii Skay4041]|uniref:Uncharacterized protein n=1 Tax=Amanita thiersii Skay4041 TaxID=703135 RepID=A0A2A9NWB7_9AGAR|nr:hypothetical protein AMATHDRAFT_74502 [Amanita thiersii Skay4041]
MEEVHPARQSSGIYHGHYGSTHSVASNASLRGHAVIPAGAPAVTDPAGSPPSGVDDSTHPPAPPPPHVPFYKRRWFIISQIILIPIGIAMIFILLFPVVRAIVQLIVFHTGKVSATIRFTEPMNVSWIINGTTIPIGTVNLPAPLVSKHSRADINQTGEFKITDQATFNNFTEYMITAPNFTWVLEAHNLRVNAVKFPVAKGITFKKSVTLNGINNFQGNVVLRDLQLPSDNPAGGINFVAVTELTNQSPFTLDLGTIIFSLSYRDVLLGIGSSSNVKLMNGTNSISLNGTLGKHEDPGELSIISELFTNYLNGDTSPVLAIGQSTLQDDGTAISWLSSGLQALRLNVPFKAFTPIVPIRTITIGDLALGFDAQNPWSPNTQSNTVQATLKLPFGFDVSIDQIQNNFNISKDGQIIAGLSTPIGASRSSISVLGPADTEGVINITISNTTLSVPEPQHAAFSSFNANLTSSEITEFRLVGNARALANMSIGQITLDPIKVDVPTTLKGLNGLNGLVNINGVDVTGGTTDFIDLKINVTIVNPSSLELKTGDLTLQLLRGDTVLGTAMMPDLSLDIGNNSVVATSLFSSNASPEGRQTLNDFVGRKDVQLVIAGFDGSTNVSSLVEAFETLKINVTLPGMASNLLDTAALTVLPSTGQTNISHVTVTLTNPFSVDLKVRHIMSTVSAFGIPLGTINTKIDFSSTAKSTTTSPPLDLTMNFDPSALFSLTRRLAIEAGLDVAPLDAIVQLGGIQGFDLPSYVQTAFKQLKSDVELATDITIGDYQTTLEFSQTGIATATDKTLDLILPVLARPIVQDIVGGSTLNIDSILISDPKQTSFGTKLKGSIGNAGPFDAIIAFPSGLITAWNGQTLGNLKLSNVQVVGDVGASIDADSTFTVADVPHLTEFTKTLLTEQSFTWDITGENLTGIDVAGVSLSSKQVTLSGFNGLKDGVHIKSFDLPSNDPAGGIHLTLEATTTSPSQVGIQLSSIAFNTFVGDTMIAPVQSSGQVTLSPLSTSALSLRGRLIPQQTSNGLTTVSTIFNNFLHGKDSNVIVQGAAAGSQEVTWLNDGIKVLRIETILPNQGPLQIIKSISLNQMSLKFTDESAYNPSTSSNSTDAAFQIPFAFPLNVKALEQTLLVGFEGNSIAQLRVPKGPSTTDVGNRIIHLGFNDIPFSVFDDQHSSFRHFLSSTTMGDKQKIQLSGSANADADTAVGLLSLQGITFAVDTEIPGLQGLNAVPPKVTNLDVSQGFPDFLLIKVDSTLFNPRDQTIGSASLNDLVIVPGNASYSINVHFAPSGSAVEAGRTLLQNFIEGVDVTTSISGSVDSTTIESLQEALSDIHLSPVVIPSLKQNLVTSASLSFPIDIVTSGIASSSFALSNPFTASINLLRVSAIAKYHGLTVGTIDNVDVSGNPIHAPGHNNVTSPALPMKFNLDPLSIIQLLTTAAKENNVNLGPLTDLFQFVIDNPDFHPPVSTQVDTNNPTCVSGHQFDAAGAILSSLARLPVDLHVQSSVKLDDYATDLTFDQKAVSSHADKTALFLIGAVAGPVAQHLVDGALLSFTRVDVTNITDKGFDLYLVGSLTNVGPLDALITFTEPLTVSWNDRDIAEITLDPICAAANEGVPDYRAKARGTIIDQPNFTSFATFLLHNPSFEWTISTKRLRLNALGTIFDNVSLSKKLIFKAFNGLPGVTVNNFDLPSDDPAGGIHIETDAVIPSLAQVGIELGVVTFDQFYRETFVGPLTARNLTLAPESVTISHLSGHITPKSGSDIDQIGELFSNFLSGKNSTLSTRGNTVTPPGAQGPVGWLSQAFKTLDLPVILPGMQFKIIQSIELKDLEVVIQSDEQAFSPPTSSKNTLATYKNPFGFSLQVIASGQTLTLGAGETDIAQLKLPKTAVNGGISTGNVADLLISFDKQPLVALNNDAFKQMFAEVTLEKTVSIDLRGTADVTARTSIGDVPISGIPFDVESQLQGINSFNHEASLSNVTVAGSGGAGGNEFIVSPLTTMLQNPSNVSLSTNNIALPVIYQGVRLGRAAINSFDLVPGGNIVDTEFHYQPDNANDTVAQSFLTRFIQSTDDIPLTIDGDSASSPYGSLQLALAGVQISTTLKGLNHPNLITHVNVFITLESLITNLVSIDFDLNNPLDAEMALEFVQADSGLDGVVYAKFAHTFTNFVVPPHSTVNSGRIDGVILTKGVAASLGIIPRGVLDISAANTLRIGSNGYEIPWLQLKQTGVPTSYSLLLGGADIGLSKNLPLLSSLLKASTTPSTVGATTSSNVQTSATRTAIITGSSAPATDIRSSAMDMNTLTASTIISFSTPKALTT